jgi:starch phosphorylase
LDAHIPDWRNESANLRYAVALPLPELDKAHREAKRQLFQMVEARRGVALDPDALTLGFARRATAYKRADLLFSDPEQLKHISRHGRVQLIYAGKAHPRDKMGKDMIRRVFEAASELGRWVDVVYLENYDMDTAKLLCGGVDVWVNTPRKPQEASGTSGMKAALNGVPSLSVLDGWWIEGHVENVTGWAIGDDWEPSTDEEDAAALYQKLERVCAMYYGSPRSFSEMRRYSIALNASFFNAQRMMQQYAHGAYHLAWSEPVRARDPSDA